MREVMCGVGAPLEVIEAAWAGGDGTDWAASEAHTHRHTDTRAHELTCRKRAPHGWRAALSLSELFILLSAGP